MSHHSASLRSVEKPIVVPWKFSRERRICSRFARDARRAARHIRLAASGCRASRAPPDVGQRVGLDRDARRASQAPRRRIATSASIAASLRIAKSAVGNAESRQCALRRSPSALRPSVPVRHRESSSPLRARQRARKRSARRCRRASQTGKYRSKPSRSRYSGSVAITRPTRRDRARRPPARYAARGSCTGRTDMYSRTPLQSPASLLGRSATLTPPRPGIACGGPLDGF